jgi:hypothetical protein
MLKWADDDTPFATGCTRYHNVMPTPSDETPKIMLWVNLGNGIRRRAMVDTGAPYLVLSPEIADLLDKDLSNECGHATLKIRGEPYQGRLVRHGMTLLAEEGEGCTIETTAFVPAPEAIATWGDTPIVLGFYCCLDRLRFAIDPDSMRFFFGVP